MSNKILKKVLNDTMFGLTVANSLVYFDGVGYNVGGRHYKITKEKIGARCQADHTLSR